MPGPKKDYYSTYVQVAQHYRNVRHLLRKLRNLTSISKFEWNHRIFVKSRGPEQGGLACISC